MIWESDNSEDRIFLRRVQTLPSIHKTIPNAAIQSNRAESQALNPADDRASMAAATMIITVGFPLGAQQLERSARVATPPPGRRRFFPEAGHTGHTL